MLRQWFHLRTSTYKSTSTVHIFQRKCARKSPSDHKNVTFWPAKRLSFTVRASPPPPLNLVYCQTNDRLVLMFFHQPGCMLCIQNYGGQHYVFRWTDNPWCEIASEQTTTSVQHHEGSSHLPMITICHTISTNGTAINSSEPNQQPKSRSAETQTVPLKLFFWEWNEPWPAI